MTFVAVLRLPVMLLLRRPGGRLHARAALCMLLALLLQDAAAMAPVLRLEARPHAVEIGGHSEAWTDPSGKAAVEQVAAAPSIPWRRSVPGEIHRVGRDTAFWLRFTLHAADPTERWYLEVPFPAVDRVTLFTRDARGGWGREIAGDWIAVADWPVPYRHPVLPVALSSGEPTVFLLKVENRANFSAPLRLLTESHLADEGSLITLVLGMYFGLALLAIVFSLGGAILLRERTHVFYAMSVASMALVQAAMTGLGGVHLWPEWPWWNERSSLVLPVLAMAATLLFFTAVLSLRDRSLPFYRVVASLAALSVPLAVVIALLDSQARFTTMLVYVAAGATVGGGAVLWSWRRGDRYAPWVVAALAPVAVGCALPLLRGLGLLPMNAWTIHGMQLALALEIPALLLVLLLRSRRRREHARRVLGLDRIDAATGLLNAQVFDERLERLVARSLRLKIRSAVLLAEIVNVEAVQRQFGREPAREMPLRVAGRLLAATRNIDTVARLGEHRFGLLLEGPLTADEVAQAAPRLVARCLMPDRDRPLEWTPRLLVAQGLIPMDGEDPAELMQRLEALLEHEDHEDAGGVRLLSPLLEPAGAV